MLREHCPVTRAVSRRTEPSVLDASAGSKPGRQARLLRGSPFAVEAGLRLVFVERGHAVVTLPIHRGVGTEIGTAHPGAMTALVEAAGAAATADFQDEHDASLSGIALNFLRRGSERPLVAEARVLGGDGAVGSCEVEVRDWNGELVAKGFLSYGAAE
jgi:uncharacterized protein (TIGR00369 family)